MSTTTGRDSTMIDEKDVRNGIVTFAVLIVLPAFAAGLAVGWAVWGR